MNHIVRVRPVPCVRHDVQPTRTRHASAWDVAVSERLQLLLDQRVGEELRGARNAPAVQGYGGVLTELSDVDRIIMLFGLRLKLDTTEMTEDEEKTDPSARAKRELSHFGAAFALLPFVMQGVDWTDPLQVIHNLPKRNHHSNRHDHEGNKILFCPSFRQARAGRSLLRRAESILQRESIFPSGSACTGSWDDVLRMHNILGMLHGRFGGCLQV